MDILQRLRPKVNAGRKRQSLHRCHPGIRHRRISLASALPRERAPLIGGDGNPVQWGVIPKETAPRKEVLFLLEAPPRFELGHEGFADLCLTAWLWRRQDLSSIANARAFVKSLPNSFFRRFWVLSGRAGQSGGAPAAGGGSVRCDRGNHGTGEVCGRGTGRHRAGMLREGTRARYFLYVGALKWGWRQTRSRG